MFKITRNMRQIFLQSPLKEPPQKIAMGFVGLNEYLCTVHKEHEF